MNDSKRIGPLTRLEWAAAISASAVLVAGVVFWGLQVKAAYDLLALAYGW